MKKTLWSKLATELLIAALAIALQATLEYQREQQNTHTLKSAQAHSKKRKPH